MDSGRGIWLGDFTVLNFTTSEISERVGGRLVGSHDLVITGVESLDEASQTQISFINAPRYAAAWATSRAAAALLDSRIDLEPGDGRAFVRVDDPDLALAAVLEMFAPPLAAPPGGVDPHAAVHESATLERGVTVGACSIIGPRVRIGDGAIIHANVTVLDDSVIGAGCVLWPGVVVRERCEMGNGCIVHPNCTIGADGFGFRPSPDGQSIVKIPQIGTVRIGCGVELGAGTCVDRGKFSATTIGDGTKIDNLCQIGHNCRIGRCTVIAGMTGMGGSVVIGNGAMIGGGVIIKEHVTIGDGARLGGASRLIHDLPAGETWHGNPAHDARATFREYAAIRRLPTFMRSMRGSSKNANDR